MAKKPSAETQLRVLKRDLEAASRSAAKFAAAAETYRVRATKAEQDAAEWKRRFDMLLGKVQSAEVAKLKGASDG